MSAMFIMVPAVLMMSPVFSVSMSSTAKEIGKTESMPQLRILSTIDGCMTGRGGDRSPGLCFEDKVKG